MQFRNEFDFLSNFYHAPITVILRLDKQTVQATFPTVENAFQAMKDLSRYQEFQQITPGQAKRLGRKVSLRPDWESIKDNYMERLVREKFRQHPDLLQRLKALNGLIQEDNTWGDRYWGVCNGTGQNKLGKILMKIRDE